VSEELGLPAGGVKDRWFIFLSRVLSELGIGGWVGLCSLSTFYLFKSVWPKYVGFVAGFSALNLTYLGLPGFSAFHPSFGLADLCVLAGDRGVENCSGSCVGLSENAISYVCADVDGVICGSVEIAKLYVLVYFGLVQYNT
jgi:hypothetical protein